MQLLSFAAVFRRSRLRLRSRRISRVLGDQCVAEDSAAGRFAVADASTRLNGLDPRVRVECDTSQGWMRGASDLDMGKILLARSATTDFDEQGRIVGTLDLPINVRGQAEVASLAQEFRRFPLTTLYSSPGESARQTAQQLGEMLGVKVRILKDLKNLDFGLWQGLQTSEVRRKHPKLFKQWEESPRGICPPAGETVDEVLERLPKSLKPVLKRRESTIVALIAPDPLRQLIACYLKGAPVEQVWEQGAQAPWELIEPTVGSARREEM
jgi:probable phosphoglycerate mutase